MLESTRLRPNPEQLFECFIVASAPEPGEAPTMRVLYPQDYAMEEDTRRNLPKFCFPCENYQPEVSQCFTFVLTDLESKYRFGHCLYPRGAQRCYCFFSHLPWYEFFYQLLEHIYPEVRKGKEEEKVFPCLDQILHHPARKTWYKGGETEIKVHTENMSFSLPVPDPTKLPNLPDSHNVNMLYTNLSHQVLLATFGSLLFERRILITSSNMEVLTACVHGAATILYPLYWQHIYCPVIPPHLMDYCCAPMPFLIGVHSSLMDKARKMPLGDIVIVDVDENAHESNFDDVGELPEEVVSHLKHILKKQSSAFGEAVPKAFLNAFAAMIGEYKSAFAIAVVESEVNGKMEKKKQFVFDQEAFKRTRPDMMNVLEHLLHFQHFQQFIAARLVQANSDSAVVYRDLFDEEMQAFYDELRGSWRNPESVRAGFINWIGKSKRLGEKLKKEMKKVHEWTKEQGVIPSGFQALQEDKDSHALRHSEESLIVEAQVIKAKMVRGGPPKVPKPYAQHKEEKEQISRSNNSSPNLPRRGDGGPEGRQSEEKLISLTPPSQRSSLGDSGADLAHEVHNFDSLDSTSTSSTSSSTTSREGDHDLFSKAADRQLAVQHPCPPIPPPRPHRKKAHAFPSDKSSTLSSSVITNQSAAEEKSLTMGSRPLPQKQRKSLDFSSSIAEALIDIDPLMADCLQDKPLQHTRTPVALDLAKLPPPLEPIRSDTPTSGSGRSSSGTPTSSSDQNASEVDKVGFQKERKRSNAMQTVYRTLPTPCAEGGDATGSKEKDPFADLLQGDSQWLHQKSTVGQGGPP